MNPIHFAYDKISRSRWQNISKEVRKSWYLGIDIYEPTTVLLKYNNQKTKIYNWKIFSLHIRKVLPKMKYLN